MKTYKELKEQYNNIQEIMHSAGEQFNNGNPEMGSQLYDSAVKKFAGWRRSLLTTLAHTCKVTYKECAANNARFDESDLYAMYVRHF